MKSGLWIFHKFTKNIVANAATHNENMDIKYLNER